MNEYGAIDTLAANDVLRLMMSHLEKRGCGG